MKRCIFYGDCNVAGAECEDDNPHFKCTHRVIIPEYRVLAMVHQMSVESLDPENYENLRVALNRLSETRGLGFKA